MICYMPDRLFKDIKNKAKAEKILADIPDTSIRMSGIKTFDDAIKEIKELGETEVAKFLSHQ